MYVLWAAKEIPQLLKSNTIGIIADDLTGANDTSLQFHLKGCNTQILLDYTQEPHGIANTQAWAISTETRNKPAEEGVEIVKKATKAIIKNLNTEYIYKKIDSTLRGNIAQESLAVMEVMGADAAVIVPAFPSEGRTTVGGYHLLKGMPLERTDVARDPVFPVYQSHIPTLLQQQVNCPEIVAHITLGIVMKGAGPILQELQKLVKEHKKLIVVDAVTTTDMEQIALAIEKSSYKLLPCGAAGLAQALTHSWLPDTKYQHIAKVIPDMPVLILCGSRNSLSKTQIKRLAEFDEFDSFVFEITSADILKEPSEELIQRVKDHLESERVVAVHYTGDEKEPENTSLMLMNYLSSLSKSIVKKQDLIFVTVGGETSYRCCNAIGSKQLQLIDEIEPTIPVCLDHEAQWIVTKSGNMGTPNTLVNIVKYFRHHNES